MTFNFASAIGVSAAPVVEVAPGLRSHLSIAAGEMIIRLRADEIERRRGKFLARLASSRESVHGALSGAHDLTGA